MNNLTIADIQCHMAGITYQVTGLSIFQTIHRRAYASVRCR